MSRKSILISCLILLLLLFFGFWFVNNFEYKEIDADYTLTGEAQKNPFYAARIFLRKMGYDARKLGITELKQSPPAKNETLIIATNRVTLRKHESDAILDWVAKGGHLVIQPGAQNYNYDIDKEIEPEEDLLLDQIGIQGVYSSDAVWSDAADDYLFPDVSEDIEINFDGFYILTGETDDDIIFFDANGTHLIHRKYQNGAVTILSDIDFLTNSNIDDFDHARALIEILRLRSSMTAKIWLLNDEEMPSLIALLWENTFPLVVVSLLMLGIWLSGAFFRFGPLLPQPVAERRQLLEHIDASGKFFWKNQRKQRLTQSVRTALHKKIARSYPGWEQLSPQEQRTRMIELLDMPESTLSNLLDTDSELQPQDFTRLIRQLENTRKQL